MFSEIAIDDCFYRYIDISFSLLVQELLNIDAVMETTATKFPRIQIFIDDVLI